MMQRNLGRTTFASDRGAEYFTPEGLTKLTEQSVESFGDVVIKELGDNALDAAETAKVVPEIVISCERIWGITRVSVSDNGEGIPPNTVESMQNFSTLTSDKAHYRTPTRGSQGNALKTIIGIPYALGIGDEPVVIEGSGTRHTIKPVIDAAGVPRLPRKVETIERSRGTKVTVPLSTAEVTLDLSWWTKAFALFNPHAFVNLEQFGEGVDHVNGSPKRSNFTNQSCQSPYPSANTYPTTGVARTGTTRPPSARSLAPTWRGYWRALGIYPSASSYRDSRACRARPRRSGSGVT